MNLSASRHSQSQPATTRKLGVTEVPVAVTQMHDAPAEAEEKTVLLVAPRGFCAGVVRAIDIVERAIEIYGAPIYVRKEIVHNRYVVGQLAKRGAIFVDEIDEVPPGARLVFSAHGVAPEVRDAADERYLRVIDATCPLVTKVHLEAVSFAKRGSTILLIGHEDHDEMIGTLGEAPDRTIVVSSPEQAETVEVPEGDLAYLTQTTLSLDEAGVIIGVLKRRFPHIKEPPAKDICYATENRQQAVKGAADSADYLLVVGSDSSSNSKRLVEVGTLAGMPGQLIEGPESIEPEWLEGIRTVAVSAGASAPDVLVEAVVDRLRELGFDNLREFDFLKEDVYFPLPRELRSASQLVQLGTP